MIRDSAIPGTLWPEFDIEEVRQRARQSVIDELTQPIVRIETKGDGLDWARRILARVEAGEQPGLMPVQMAKQALGLIAARGPGDDR